MLPDMSEVLNEWAQPVIVKTVTQATVNFEPIDQVAVRTIRAVVQLANKEKLNPDQIDWSLRYLLVHTAEPLTVGEFIEYKGDDYKIVEPGDWQDYGYTEAVAEEVKRALLVETFTLTYTAGANGSITGTAFQVVPTGGNGSAVTATPATGYQFVSWSDGVLTASRTDVNVIADLTVTATFEIIP
jgi:hypothetical protein